MVKLHYDYYKRKHGDKATLCFTDTDRLIYLIETDDLIEDMMKSTLCKELEFDIALDDVTPKSFAALRTKVRTPLPTDQRLHVASI